MELTITSKTVAYEQEKGHARTPSPLMSRHLVFVYGTLKRGQPNEYLINELKDVNYIGRAITCQKYPLVIGGEWRLPYLLKLDGQGKNVKGEVIEVNDEGLAILDQFEDHPDFYERMMTDVQLLTGDDQKQGTAVLKCWVYFNKTYDGKDVESPHYKNYDAYGGHGQEYDISENEDHPSNRHTNEDKNS